MAKINLLKTASGSVPAPPPGKASLFATQEGLLALKNDDGSVAGTGGINAINWKNGTPGNPYIDGDTAMAAVGEMVMVSVADPGSPETVTVQLPAASVVGAQIILNNLVDKKLGDAGFIDCIPAAGESVAAGGVDQVVRSIADIGILTLMSDGNGIWHPISIGGVFLLYPLVP